MLIGKKTRSETQCWDGKRYILCRSTCRQIAMLLLMLCTSLPGRKARRRFPPDDAETDRERERETERTVRDVYWQSLGGKINA